MILKLIYFKNLKINIFESYVGKNFILDINDKSVEILIKKVYIRDNVKINISKGNIIIGKNVFLNSYTSINCRKSIIIGDNTIIGEGVRVYDHDHIFTNNETLIRLQGFSSDKVLIGSNVWIGSNALILKGSKIGDNSIIAAGSIVKGEIPSDSVYINRVQKEIRSIK